MNPHLQQFFTITGQFLQAPIFKISDESISILWLLKLVLSFLTVMMLSIICKRLLKNLLLPRLGASQGQREAIAIGTSSTENLVSIQQLGVDLAIDYKTERFEEKVANADVVFDTVGGETRQRSQQLEQV